VESEHASAPLLATDPKLTKCDESTICPGLFLCGPQVRQDDEIFCFIYKYRQRFAVVVNEIAKRLGMPTQAREKVGRSVSQSVRQSASQSASQPARPPTSRPVSQHDITELRQHEAPGSLLSQHLIGWKLAVPCCAVLCRAMLSSGGVPCCAVVSQVVALCRKHHMFLDDPSCCQATCGGGSC
jgi:hypothetical protein